MSNANKLLSSMLGVEQFEKKPTGIQGILQTKDYEQFIILDDGGNELYRFTGAKLANRCLPGDHISWKDGKCHLELRDEYPPIIGSLELSNKSKFGLTSRGIYMYLFTPYDKRYPQFVVGCSEKDTSKNRVVLIKFDDWQPSSTFPRGLLQQTFGVSGDYEAERQALIWQACPWKYPKGTYIPQSKENIMRRKLDGYTFHIDPEGCKDVDDVLTFKKLENENDWQITITISDVATYVEDGGVVDIFASLIGQTVYDVDGHILRPMLPKEYSEEVCSLLPGKQSYGISLQFVWNGKEITNKEWFESVLYVDKTYTYEEFQHSDLPYKVPLSTFTSYLAKEKVTDSHKWIEHCMLFYNMEAGRMLKDVGMGILRRHSEPNRERLELYKKYVPDLEKLAFSSAEYCLADEKNTTHFGINSEAYAHASSPIRRYADLVNQRVLKIIINNSKEKYYVPIAMYDMNLRSKLNKNFSRDQLFLSAITSGNTLFKANIIETIRYDNIMKIKLYVPEWNKSISTRYSYVDDTTVLSRDEKREINISMFREVIISCAANMNMRNWKERIIINIM